MLAAGASRRSGAKIVALRGPSNAIVSVEIYLFHGVE